MLTHRVLAEEQGYSSLSSIFSGSNDSFAKKEHAHIAYLVDAVDPACDAYSMRQFGKMFQLLGVSLRLRNTDDKHSWRQLMTELNEVRRIGTIGDAIDRLRAAQFIRLPRRVEDLEDALPRATTTGDADVPKALRPIHPDARGKSSAASR